LLVLTGKDSRLTPAPPGTSVAHRGQHPRQAHREAMRIEQLLEASLEPVGHVTTHLESAADHDELHPHELRANRPEGK